MAWLLRKIKNFFRGKRDYEESSPVPNDYGSGEEIDYTWGYIVAHTKATGGAVGIKSGKKFSEYEYSKEVALLNKTVIPYATRDTGGVRAAATKLKKVGATASIEFHLNSYNKQVRGAEILVQAGDSASYEAAENLLEAFKVAYPDHTIRGVKVKKKGDRGWYNLEQARRAGMKIRILTEFFFIDSEYIEANAMAAFLRKNLVKL